MAATVTASVIRQMHPLRCQEAAQQPSRRGPPGQLDVGLLAAALPGHPLRYDPQAAPETLLIPIRRQSSAPLRQPASHSARSLASVGFQHALTAAENVAVATAQDAADQLAASARRSRDLLDRLARLSQRLNAPAIFLALEEAFILDALGTGQQRGVDHRRTKNLADRLH